MKTFRIGIAGLDTSHVPAFANLLHDTSQEFHVPGGRIVAAFPGGSTDFDLSISRVGKFTAELRDDHGVEIVNSFSSLRDMCDVVMLESIDGRIHLDQFREAAQWGVPVFIDKPLAISSSDACEIVRIAKEQGVRVSSASAIRFAESFRYALNDESEELIFGGDFYGPMAVQEKCPGYFWYGIHCAEMLFATMGLGCQEVLAIRDSSHDLVMGRWSDGRVGSLRGNRMGNNSFGGVIHRKTGSLPFSISRAEKPYYASLLESVMSFFAGETELVCPNEMIEVIRFLEAANESSLSRQWVALQ